jgi:putative phage-type endonuclease
VRIEPPLLQNPLLGAAEANSPPGVEIGVNIMENSMNGQKEQWLEKRRSYITGTDLAGIMGLSPFSTPLTVWLEKKGLSEPTPPNNAMRMGLRMENAILGIYAEETGEDLDRAGPYDLMTSEYADGLIAATLDARHSTGDRRPVDAKNIRIFDAKKWGDSETGDIPKHYHLQLVSQMMVTDTAKASLAVLFSGSDFRVYTIERDKELDGMVCDFASDWWKKHIINGEQPEIDGSQSACDWIRRKLAKAQKGLVIEPNKEIEESAVALKSIKGRIKELEESETTIENQLKLLIGDAEEVSGILTWKNNKDSVKTDWESVAKAVNAPAEIIEQFTQTKPGARVLRLK